MPEQKIILSVIGQVLATTNEKELLRFIGMVNSELNAILEEFDVQEWTESFKYDASCVHCQAMTSHDKHFYAKVLEIGEHKIEAVTFID